MSDDNNELGGQWYTLAPREDREAVTREQVIEQVIKDGYVPEHAGAFVDACARSGMLVTPVRGKPGTATPVHFFTYEGPPTCS